MWSEKYSTRSKWIDNYPDFFGVSTDEIEFPFRYNSLFCSSYILRTYTFLLSSLVIWAGLEDLHLIIFSPGKLDSGFLRSCFSLKKNLSDLFSSSYQVRWKRIDLPRLMSYQIVILFHAYGWPPFFGLSMGNLSFHNSSQEPVWFIIWNFLRNFENFRSLMGNILVQPLINTFYFEGLFALG